MEKILDSLEKEIEILFIKILTAANRCREDNRFTRDRNREIEILFIKILTATNRCGEDTRFTRDRERDRDLVDKDTDSYQ